MRKRILYVHNSADIYGASRSLVRLLGKLERTRFEPLVLLPEDGPLVAQLRARNVEVLIHSPLSIITRGAFHSWRLFLFVLDLPRSVFGVWRILRQRKIDLVHTNTGVILAPGLAARLSGIPHVWHVRDSFHEFRLLWALYSACMRWSSDRIVAVSNAMAKQFATRDKVTVIPNGFSPDEFAIDRAALRRDFRRQFGISEEEIVITCVGRIKLARKGQEIFLEAAALLKHRGRRLRYLVVGSPSPEQMSHLARLKDLAIANQLTDDVIFTGELADTKPAYAASDIFVLPSTQPEPFGGVVMEAMSMGLPVIGTSVGGTPEQIVDGETGFLVPPADAMAITEKIERLVDEPQLRLRMSETGPKRVAEHFSLNEMVSRIESLYETIFKARGPENPATRNGASRVLFINNSADIYGASRCLARFLGEMDRTKFEPLVVLPETGPLQPILEQLGVEVMIHPGMSIITRRMFSSWRIIGFLLGFPRSVLFFWRLIKRRRISIVHTNTGVMISPALAAKCAGIPHVWHVRDWFGEFGAAWKYYSRYILKLSHRVLNVSHAIAQQFPASQKVEVVHDGFALKEFDLDPSVSPAAFRDQFGLGDQQMIGCVGRIKFVRKGQDIFVRAAALLKARGVAAKYLIIGSPFPGNESHLIRLRELIAELHLDDDVVVTGELNDVRSAYVAMDVFALPSGQPEPFGGVVMEAMGMGLPVVATNIGGSLDQIAEGESGFLVPPNDPAALADKLEILLRDANLRKRFGETGRRRIAEMFSLTEMARKIERVYEECLATK